MKQWKIFAPLLLGFVPLLIGEFQNYLVILSLDTELELWVPYGLFSFVFAVLWCALGFLGRRLTGKTWLTVLLLNLPALIFLVLTVIQGLQRAFWSNAIGLWSQLFFLPLMTWGSRLCFMFHPINTSMISVFFVTFLLMVGLSALGCCIHKKTARGN